MYKFKEAARRGSALLAAASLLAGIGASAMPALASADALNPLTDRSLLLSSSSPGWVDTDGSGNAGTSYALPGSGPNGRQTGETFTFNTSTDSTSTNTLKAFTFQYCTGAAGECAAPGDDSGSTLSGGTRGPDVTTGASPTSDLNVVTGHTPVEGTDFKITVDGVLQTGSDWSMTAGNQEDSTDVQTGKNNYITLKSSTGINPGTDKTIKVEFIASNGNYITNPGSDVFFVKINDYGSTDFQNFRDAYPLADTDCDSTHTTFVATGNGGTDTCNANVIDGGVTVANLMNQSIQISTKVLETMEFSVGTVDPDTIQGGAHTACDAVHGSGTGNNNNAITIGKATQENSLEVGHPHDAFSYWRLSSNSSNGATVYYAGYTLSNTENDQIKGIFDLVTADGHSAGDGSPYYSHPGSEQFGLGIDSDYSDNTAAPLAADFVSAITPGGIQSPGLGNLTAVAGYGSANGSIATQDAGAQFAFDYAARTQPVPIAGESTDVVDCSTGQMRYLGNIAATTPAGIYTTKINYVAAPEY